MKLYSNDLYAAIAQQRDSNKQAIALIDTKGRQITYEDLLSTADSVAKNLINNGFEKGDRVLILVRPSIELIVLLIAIIRAGGMIIVADPGMGSEIFASRVKLAQPTWIFSESVILALQKFGFVRKMLRRKGVEIPEIGSLYDSNIVSIGSHFPAMPKTYDYKNLQKQTDTTIEEENLNPAEDAYIAFTSGTTDLPKGVVSSNKCITATVQIAAENLKPQASDIFYSPYFFMIFPALISGAATVLPKYSDFRVRRFLDDLTRFKVTIIFGIPKEFEAIITYCHERKQKFPASVKTILLGSTPVLTPFLRRFRDVLASSTKVYCVYGMTEILPVCVTDLDEKISFAGKGDYLGKPLSGVTAKLAQDGELILQGPNLYSHYLGSNPVREHPTGDIATINENGDVILVGRKKDMIIKGHYNIYPTLMESTIAKIPGVANCAMIGIYNDKISDEEIVLVVEKNDTRSEAEYEKYLREQLLHGEYSIDVYAQPDKVVFMQLPTSGRSQKVDKKALKEMLK